MQLQFEMRWIKGHRFQGAAAAGQRRRQSATAPRPRVLRPPAGCAPSHAPAPPGCPTEQWRGRAAASPLPAAPRAPRREGTSRMHPPAAAARRLQGKVESGHVLIVPQNAAGASHQVALQGCCPNSQLMRRITYVAGRSPDSACQGERGRAAGKRSALEQFEHWEASHMQQAATAAITPCARTTSLTLHLE